MTDKKSQFYNYIDPKHLPVWGVTSTSKYSLYRVDGYDTINSVGQHMMKNSLKVKHWADDRTKQSS